MSFKEGLIFVLLSCILVSCNYEKKLQAIKYFNDSLDSSHKVISNYEATIKVDDRLVIRVSALNPESTLPYNLAEGATASGGSGGFLVEKNGTILFPQLGKIYAEGKTLHELRDTLQQLLTKYLTDPLVTVSFANSRVIVMGEVAKVGVIPIPDGKLTILEAITIAGDIPYTGRKDNVLIIRDENGQRNFARVNIQSNNIFKSPYYQLKQNDLIYVEQNLEKIKDKSRDNLVKTVSPITTILSIILSIVVINNLIRK